jgi:hypothetical protein
LRRAGREYAYDSVRKSFRFKRVKKQVFSRHAWRVNCSAESPTAEGITLRWLKHWNSIMMNENRLQTATLLTWTLQVYKDFKMGKAQTPHEAVLARSMQNHKEWWPDWEAFDRGTGVEDGTTTARLVHIHHDAKVMLQVEQSEPKEIREFYDALREKGFTEFESVHTIALGLTEEFAHAREHNEDFYSARYVERAAAHTKQSLSRPNMTRLAGAKAY